MWYRCGRVQYCSDASVYNMHNDRLVLEYFRRLINFRKWSRVPRFGVTTYLLLAECVQSFGNDVFSYWGGVVEYNIWLPRFTAMMVQQVPVMSLESSGFIENRPESVLRRVFSLTFLPVHLGLFLNNTSPITYFNLFHLVTKRKL